MNPSSANFLGFSGSQPEVTRQFRNATKVDHTLAPTHQIAFPGVQYIHSVDFSPDGATAYCLVDGQRVDLWGAGLSWWPEALGGVLGLVLIVYLLVVARVRRHPQVKGEPHCRKCNYNVMSQAPGSVGRGARAPAAGVLCPECGVDLSERRPRIGRSMWRRLRIPTVVMLALAIGYACLFIGGYSRNGRLGIRAGMWSAWVDAYAEKKQTPWLIKHRVAVHRIVTVDTATGAIKGCLRTMRGNPEAGLRVSPDGRYLAVGDGDELLWVNSHTGWAAASTTGGTFRKSVEQDMIVGFGGSVEDPLVYYGAMDRASGMSRLLEWNPRKREQRVVIAEPAYFRTDARGGQLAFARRYVLLNRADGLAFASASDFMQAYEEAKYTIDVHGPISQGGVLERHIEMPDKQLCASPIIASIDGGLMFLIGGSTPRGLFAVDARTGEQTEKGSSEVTEPPDRRFTISADGSRAFVPVYRNSILVRDLSLGRWIARLQYPEPFIAPHVSVSPNGRWLAAVPFKSTAAAGGPYIHELFLYDLSLIDRK